MKIAFVHNKWFPYSKEKPYKGNAGGAALTNIAVIQEGEKRGHKIDLLFAYKNKNDHKEQIDYMKYNLDEADLIIVSHIPKFNKTKFLNTIINNHRFVRWDHAYDFCKNGVANMCANVCYDARCKCCSAIFNHRLHDKAILNVFQSPLHQEVHERTLKVKMGNIFILPSPIDVNLFKPDDSIKRNPNLYLVVGSMMKHKGMNNILEFIDKKPRCTFLFIGEIKDYLDELKKRKNCILKGHLNNWELPNYYNEATYYIHLPLWWEPSSRSTMEAILMGCKLIVNDRVGTMTYNFVKNRIPVDSIEKREEIRQIIKDAPTKFWEAIENAYNGNNKK